MDIRKARVDTRIVDVIDLEEYCNNPNKYPPGQTAILHDGMLYPIKGGKNEDRVGVYHDGMFVRFIKPLPDDIDKYIADGNVINFDEVNSIKEAIEAQDKLRSMERTILTTVDNIFIPQIKPTDGPELKAMKEAVTAKNMDLDKYAARFGPKFNNDKRLFSRDTMTLGKMVQLANIFDMDIVLTIKDKSPNVPNPMGREVTVTLTSNENSISMEEGE